MQQASCAVIMLLMECPAVPTSFSRTLLSESNGDLKDTL